MDVVNHHICFITLYGHLGSKSKATLRLVCKELRDAVNLNVRGLAGPGWTVHNYKPVDMSVLISKLPNLESINTEMSFSPEGFVNVFQGAQRARRLTSLVLNDRPFTYLGAMNGLLHLTTVIELGLMRCELTGDAISQIKPGDQPHLQKLWMFSNGLSDDLVGAMNGLLHLTSLQVLRVGGCKLTGDAISQIKPGDWPHLQKLGINSNDLSDNKEGARKGLLHLSLYR